MKIYEIPVALFGLAIGLVPTCRADMVSLAPGSYANLSENNPGTPAKSYVFTPTPGPFFNDMGGTQYGSPIVSSGALFDLSGLPKGDVITAATLSLTVTNYGANSISSAGFGLSGFTSTNPTITEAEFFSASTSIGSVSLPGFGGNTSMTYTFDVTHDIQGGVDFGFILGVSGSVSSDNPVLTISYTGAPFLVPEPSSITMCGVAALTLACGMACRGRVCLRC